MKHGRPHWGEEATVGASPLKNYENKRFATYSSLWGAFSLCEGISATFLLMETPFRHVEAFFAMWAFLLFCSPYRGIFFHVGGLFGLAPSPTLRKFLRVPMGHAMTSI